MKLTEAMLRRYEAARPSFPISGPCVICGGKLAMTQWDRATNTTSWVPGHDPTKGETCGHDLNETAAAIMQIRDLSPDAYAAIRGGDDEHN